MDIVDDSTATITVHKRGEPTIWYAKGVTHLRCWASDADYLLDPGRAQVEIGAASKCDWKLRDGLGQLSRFHARLTPSGDTWQIQDLESTNGISVDGVSAPMTRLQPGAQIQLGGLTLVAETPIFRVLRAHVCRALG